MYIYCCFLFLFVILHKQLHYFFYIMTFTKNYITLPGLLLCFFLIINCLSSFAQSDCDTINAKIYQAKADSFIWITSYDSSTYYFKKAAQSYLNSDCDSTKWQKYTSCYLGISFNLIRREEYEQVIMILQDIMPIAKNNLPINHQNIGIIYNNISLCFSEKSYYNKAIENAFLSLKIRQLNKDSLGIAIIYQNIGNYYQKIGEYEISSQYSVLALNNYNKLLGKIHPRTLNALSTLCTIKQAQKKYEESTQLLKQALANIKFTQSKDKQLYHLLFTANLSTNYIKLYQPDTALFYIHKLFPLPKDNSRYLYQIYFNIAKAHKQKKEYVAAMDTFQLALNVVHDLYGQKHPRVGILYRNIGEALAEQGQLKEALDEYQKALIALSDEFEDTSIHKNPSLESVNDNVVLSNVLVPKGKRLFQYYQQTRQVAYLQAALATYQLADTLVIQMRQGLKAEGSKESLVDRAIPIYEGGIQVALEMGLKELAFEFAEKSKAIILLEAVKDVEAKMFTNIPDSLLEKEKSLKLDIAFYENKLFKLKQKQQLTAIDSSKKNKWYSIYFNLNRSLDSLKIQLEQDYPDYYTQKYNIQLATLKDVQKKLLNRNNQGLIEYFVGDSSIYVFTITAKDTHIQTIKKPKNFNATVEEWRNTLNNPANVEKYHQTAYQLYQLLIKDALLHFKKGEQITIIPDDVLGYLPFEALLTEFPNTNAKQNWASLAYLLKDYTISYGYSATLLLEGLKKQTQNNSENSYLGFAPIFKSKKNIGTVRSDDSLNLAMVQRSCFNDQELSYLRWSEQEIDTIHAIVGGQIYLSNNATKQRFLEESEAYNILHLSTHACVNDDMPSLNQIYFSDEPLLNYELYNLKLKANLAVLSACNTGAGTLKRGEGIMSLSRAFTHAGCPSLITSLWSVDDRATAEVMHFFYKYLYDGKSKITALRQAKLDYLAAHPNQELAPYFWAAFVHIGNPKPIFGTQWSSLFRGIILILGICLLLLVYLLLRKSQSKN